MFEKATRLKLRFNFRGSISVEDLWDLSTESLDQIFKILNVRSKQAQEESLLDKRTAEEDVVDLQISIVKHIVETKLSEAEAAEKAVDRRLRKQKLLSILGDQEDAELRELSPKKLRKLIEELD